MLTGIVESEFEEDLKERGICGSERRNSFNLADAQRKAEKES